MRKDIITIALLSVVLPGDEYFKYYNPATGNWSKDIDENKRYFWHICHIFIKQYTHYSNPDVIVYYDSAVTPTGNYNTDTVKALKAAGASIGKLIATGASCSDVKDKAGRKNGSQGELAYEAHQLTTTLKDGDQACTASDALGLLATAAEVLKNAGGTYAYELKSQLINLKKALNDTANILSNHAHDHDHDQQLTNLKNAADDSTGNNGLKQKANDAYNKCYKYQWFAFSPMLYYTKYKLLKYIMVYYHSAANSLRHAADAIGKLKSTGSAGCTGQLSTAAGPLDTAANLTSCNTDLGTLKDKIDKVRENLNDITSQACDGALGTIKSALYKAANNIPKCPGDHNALIQKANQLTTSANSKVSSSGSDWYPAFSPMQLHCL